MQPGSGGHHPRKLMDMIGGNPSIKMAILGSSFQHEETNYMVAEPLHEYALASVEEAY